MVLQYQVVIWQISLQILQPGETCKLKILRIVWEFVPSAVIERLKDLWYPDQMYVIRFHRFKHVCPSSVCKVFSFVYVCVHACMRVHISRYLLMCA